MIRKSNLQSMEGLVKKMARLYLGRAGMVAMDISKHWREVVGDDFYQTVFFQKVSFPIKKNLQQKNNGVLMVVCHPAVAHLIKFEEKNILQRANRYFGYPALGRIYVKQRNT